MNKHDRFRSKSCLGVFCFVSLFDFAVQQIEKLLSSRESSHVEHSKKVAELESILKSVLDAGVRRFVESESKLGGAFQAKVMFPAQVAR